MTYTLNLKFSAPVGIGRLQDYFLRRRRYVRQKNTWAYRNPETRVEFWFEGRPLGPLFLGRFMTQAEFTVNYGRPSYFGLEAEIELSAFIAEFSPQIDDPQFDGMGKGPYSPEAFFRAWNAGNEFAAGSLQGEPMNHTFHGLPRSTLQSVWTWIYQRDERRVRTSRRQDVAQLEFVLLDGRPRTIALWPLQVPIVLPEVDYVMLGRQASNDLEWAVCSWGKVENAARLAGFDASARPLDLRYEDPPRSIAALFKDAAALDPQTVRRLEPVELIDSEILEAVNSQAIQVA